MTVALRRIPFAECIDEDAHDTCPQVQAGILRPDRYYACDCTCHVDATITPAHERAMWTTYISEAN